MRRPVAYAGLIAGLAALILQFCLTIPAEMQAGRSTLGAVVFYFSFFTILTNIAMVAVYGADLLPGMAAPRFFARPGVRAGVAVAVAVVFLIYLFVLEGLWRPQGLFKVADVLLHKGTPALFVLWWLVFAADGATRWRDIPYWLVYPLLYVVYAMMRAPIAGEVPYPFLDIDKNGIGSVLLAAFLIMVLFVVLGALAVLADHGIAALRRPSRRNGP